MLTTSLLGMRVLDLTRLAPGPYAAFVLAGLGAEVIKIEEPSFGDPLRHPVPADDDSRPTLFELLNRGKKSMTLNLKSVEGKLILKQLARASDVLLEGFRPGVMARLGLHYEELCAVNPRLIYASLSGYGHDGPYAKRATHDLNCLALAGVLDLTGQEDGPPALSAVPWADMASSLWTALGIVAALIERERTGQGQWLDVSMLDGVTALTAVPLADCIGTGRPPRRGDTWLSGRLACYGVYETGDGRYMSLAALEPYFWENFCTAVGREEWMARQYASDQASLRMELAALFRSRTQADWIQVFALRDCCCEPVLTLDQAFAHPQVMQRQLLEGCCLATPLVRPTTGLPPAPRLGEHTSVILAELGYVDSDVERLKAAGVV